MKIGPRQEFRGVLNLLPQYGLEFGFFPARSAVGKRVFDIRVIGRSV
jgi:hypothetical protein